VTLVPKFIPIIGVSTRSGRSYPNIKKFNFSQAIPVIDQSNVKPLGEGRFRAAISQIYPNNCSFSTKKCMTKTVTKMRLNALLVEDIPSLKFSIF
jgi:hypothetical protein